MLFILRTYKLKSHANKSKNDLIVEVVRNYRKLAKNISDLQWNIFYSDNNSKFNKNLNIKHIETVLSERYKQTCQYQVVGMLKSYLANVKNRFKDMVLHSSLSDEQKLKLYYINKYEKWHCKEVLMKGVLIDDYSLLLARKIFKKLTKNKPSFNHINLVLDFKVAEIKESKSNNSDFNYWINLSTCKKGKKALIPVQSNEYFNSINGTIKNIVQINIKNNKPEISFVKEIETKVLEETSDRLGLDIGIVNLITTEHGDLLGRKLMKNLKRMDLTITKLFKNLQKQKIKPNTNKRYVTLNRKFREYVKNEIGRIINNLIKKYKPSEIVIEKLDFKSPKLNKQTNRILNRFGKKRLYMKLENVTSLHNIKLTYINPAYTSQCCPKCNCVSKKNRKKQDKFRCTKCGYEKHADVVGSRNVSSRSSAEFSNLNKRQILQLLNSKNLAWREERCNSSAKNGDLHHQSSK